MKFGSTRTAQNAKKGQPPAQLISSDPDMLDQNTSCVQNGAWEAWLDAKERDTLFNMQNENPGWARFFRRYYEWNPFVKPVLMAAILGGLILVNLSGMPALAEIYYHTDENGVVHVTNLPNSPDYKLWKGQRVIIKAGIDMAEYGPLIQKTSQKYKVDYSLVKAVIKAESNFNHKAVSPKGAQGLMQLMPKTASTLQVKDSFEPASNIEGGVRYLKYLMNIYNGHLPLALAAYNAGEKAVAKYGGIPPYNETRGYVKRVMALYKQYSAELK